MPDSTGSAQQRLTLIKRLSSLPPSQLDQIIFALQPRGGLIPPATAKPGDRAAALLAWAESALGCGVAKVEQVLEVALAGQTLSEPAWMEPAAAARRDVQVGQDVTGSNVVSGDDNRIEIHHHYGLPATKPDATRQDTNEKTLIEAVWTEVEDRLRQSLHNAILIRLEMAEQRNQVTRPWDSQLRTAEQGTKDLTPGTPIADVFDRRDVGGKLLILGNPGSGKTTTMLDLAAVLIQRANDQPDHPMPVMFNLSSWQKMSQSITDWLVGELRLKYGVSQKLGQTWLAEKKLLPLLDGLDELPPERQEPVVQAINGWLQSGEGPSRLLVCSRIEEYELYAEKLTLNGAVCLEPLTDAQLQAYLTSLGMESLWETLQQDKDLLALVRTPLLLSVSILAKDGIDPVQWQEKQTTQARMDYLLDAYVGQRLHEVVKSREYSQGKQPTARKTRHQLVWLSQSLKKTSIDEFSIEEIQSDLLTLRQRKIYQIVMSFGFGMLIGLTHYLLCILFLNLANDALINENFSYTLKDSLHDTIKLFPVNDKIAGVYGFAIFRGAILGAISSIIVGIYFGIKKSRNNIEFTEALSFKEVNLFTLRKWFIVSSLLGILFSFISLITGFISWLYSPRLYILSIPASKIKDGAFDSALLDTASSSFFGAANFLAVGITPLIIIWITFWLIFGVCKGLRRTIEVKFFANQGIFRNLRLVFPTCLFFYGLISSFSVWICLFFSDFNLVIENLLEITLLGFLCSLMMSWASIGWPCIQHLMLKILLYKSKCISWNYARFLNHCTDRLLLQRVGGRYRFIHKLVQEHFAAME